LSRRTPATIAVNSDLARPEFPGTCAPSPAVATRSRLEPIFGGIAQLAATVCRTPFAFIELMDRGQAWCTAKESLPAAAARCDPFSRYALHAAGLFEVPDASQDPRFVDTEWISDPHAIRFYAGLALRTGHGDVLGVLAVCDRAPRQLSPDQRAALALLADQAVSQAELRASLQECALASEPRPGVTMPESDAALAWALLEAAPVAIYHTDGAGTSSYFNPAYRHMFGLTSGQDDSDWIRGVHPDDRERMTDAWTDFRRRPRPVHLDYRTAGDVGGVRFLSEQVVAADGVGGFVGTIIDFTDLVTARDGLRKFESLFRHTFEQAPVGIVYADRDGRLVRFNEKFCALVGFDPGELVGRTMPDLTCGEDREQTLTELARLWQGEAPSVDIETRLSRKDGSAIWVRVTTALVRDGTAVAECSVGFFRDISVRKEMAAALLASKTLVDAVIAELPVALVACDAAGHMTHHNHAAAELFSIPSSAASDPTAPEGYPFQAEMYLPDGITAVQRADRPLARALRGESLKNVELVIAPRESTPRTTLSSARRLMGPGGQQLGAVVVTQDITELKAAALELERVHKQLVGASRQAGMAEIATNILHNVGNVLQSVNISASLVTENVKQSKAPGVRRVAALLLEHGQDVGSFVATDARGKQIPAYLATLGEQLLIEQAAALRELASLRSNIEHIKDTVVMQQNFAKVCGVTEIVNIVDVVEDSLRLNADAFSRHGVTIKREFSPVPPISVDKHKVLQILVNLVSNAKNACNESGRREKLLTVRVECVGQRLRVSVKDDGVGIPAENLTRIFNHGFTTRKQGHGFGLHSCALAAQDLGGSLHAESDGHGHGATLILELPYPPVGDARV